MISRNWDLLTILIFNLRCNVLLFQLHAASHVRCTLWNAFAKKKTGNQGFRIVWTMNRGKLFFAFSLLFLFSGLWFPLSTKTNNNSVNPQSAIYMWKVYTCTMHRIHVWNEAEIDSIQCKHGCANSTRLRLLNYILYSERENSLIRLYKHVRIYIYIYK